MNNLSRAERRAMERYVASFPATLTEVPKHEWPPHPPSGTLPVRVWRSRDYLVQQYDAPEPVLCRLSINRTGLNGNRWADGIGWEDLQSIKREIGYGDHDAVEVYPNQADIVNVANMRHLWVMREPVPFAWRRAKQSEAV